MMTGALARVVAALRDADQLIAVHGELPDEITGIADDSRRVTEGGLFVAVVSHLDTALAAGASVVMVETLGASQRPALLVRDSRRAVAIAAAAAFDHPAAALRVVAVTGTNGKTTTVAILRHLLDEPGAPAASIGTLGVLVGSAGVALPGGGGLTTPGPVELQRVLRALVDAGVRTVAMETSSHALDQQRVASLRFDAALFTNFTRDHLDYHGTLEAYFAAKAQLVSLVAPQGTVVINADDPAWRALPMSPRQLRVALHAAADLCARDVVSSDTGRGVAPAARGVQRGQRGRGGGGSGRARIATRDHRYAARHGAPGDGAARTALHAAAGPAGLCAYPRRPRPRTRCRASLCARWALDRGVRLRRGP
jgi:UDP-N-acetylmuramoyl-L-alanyl-D-glutamate--2,6-diaminopimelate ligase